MGLALSQNGFYSGHFCSLIHPSTFLIILWALGMPGMTIVHWMFMHTESLWNYRLWTQFTGFATQLSTSLLNSSCGCISLFSYSLLFYQLWLFFRLSKYSGGIFRPYVFSEGLLTFLVFVFPVTSALSHYFTLNTHIQSGCFLSKQSDGWALSIKASWCVSTHTTDSLVCFPDESSFSMDEFNCAQETKEMARSIRWVLPKDRSKTSMCTFFFSCA